MEVAEPRGEWTPVATFVVDRWIQDEAAKIREAQTRISE